MATSTAAISPKTGTSPPSFLSLPAEIRNTIYTYMFVHDDPLYVGKGTHKGGQHALYRRHGDRNDDLSYPRKPLQRSSFM